MLLMSFLDSDFFLASSVLVFSGFNDVGRGRFGRIAGIFLEFGNEGFEFGDKQVANGRGIGWHKIRPWKSGLAAHSTVPTEILYTRGLQPRRYPLAFCPLSVKMNETATQSLTLVFCEYEKN